MIANVFSQRFLINSRLFRLRSVREIDYLKSKHVRLKTTQKRASFTPINGFLCERKCSKCNYLAENSTHEQPWSQSRELVVIENVYNIKLPCMFN